MGGNQLWGLVVCWGQRPVLRSHSGTRSGVHHGVAAGAFFAGEAQILISPGDNTHNRGGDPAFNCRPLLLVPGVAQNGKGGHYTIHVGMSKNASAYAACESVFGVGGCGRGCWKQSADVDACVKVVSKKHACSATLIGWCTLAVGRAKCACGWGNAKFTTDNVRCPDPNNYCEGLLLCCLGLK